jgi:hypothetical protein
LVHGAGGKPNPPHQSYDFGRPRSQRALLTLLHEVESAQLSAYVDAIPKLSLGSLRATAAAILANDAQHISVLRAMGGQSPLPSAFVTGAQ